MNYNEGSKNPLGFKGTDTVGCINGFLNDGTPIVGCDIVRIVK